MENIAGYSILFKLNDKLIAGDTSSTIDIAARVKESLTKADQGNTQRDVTGHDVTFSTGGVMQLLETEEKKVSLDADDLMELALLKGSAAKIPFLYTRGALKPYKGVMIITSYNETTDAEGSATYSLNCSVSGEFKPATE